MSTVKDALKKSLWLCGAVGQGQTPQAYLYSEALSSLNMMLDMWSSSTQGIYLNTREELTLSAGVGEYSIGSGGDFDTPRPMKIFDSFVTISNTNYPVRVIFRDLYDKIPDKTITGTPSAVYYEQSFPLGTLRFVRVPKEEYTFNLISLKPLPQYNLNDTISLPPGYLAAIVYGLAVFMGPGIGKQLRQEVIAIAQSAYDQLATNNFANQIKPLDSTNPLYGGGSAWKPSFDSGSGFPYTFPFILE